MSDQHLIGTEGDDFLQADAGNDWLEGLAGNDVLMGNDGNDLLDGGSGNDNLLGGTGDDVYLSGSGIDFVADNGGFDELRFSPGISPDQVERIRPGGSYDLILRVAGTGEQVTIGGWFYGPSYEIERVVFDDGTVWDAAETSSLRHLGTAGDDFIQGTEFDERLEGRGGNDVLLGGMGNDVYVPGFGGTDWINDFAGDDELRLSGVSPDQIERIRQSGSYDLVLRVAGTADQITLGGWFYDPSNQIERVVFDDGTVWDAATTSSLRRFGTTGDDFIQGTEYDERLEGRGGNDVLLGGMGNDLYVPGFGGTDWINDFAGDDELRLDGVSPDQVERIRQSGSYDLILRVATGDQITLGGWFYDPSNQLERIVFDDGTVWTAVDAGQLRRFGTAGDDFIQGTEYDERLEGRGGNDVLLGGAGNDVYVPGFGGSDWINDFDGNDQMRIASVSPDEVERIRQSGSYDLVLRVAGTGDQITLGGWFFSAANEIELTWFDDGVTFFPWAASTTGALRRLGTAGDDFIQATEYDERLEGRGGNDVLLGGAGNDVYVPGVGGSDWINDFSGDDELRLNGVSPGQVERIRPTGSYDLVLRIAGTSDQVTLGGWFYDPANQIERVVFDDGTVWDPATTSTLGTTSNQTPFVASPIADQGATENSGFNFVVPTGTFVDPDATDVLTLSASLAGGDPLPAWLSFDPATATFSGTPPFGTAGSVSVVVVATDSGGLSASDQFDIAIAEGQNEIQGTPGNDLLIGTAGNDLIWGGGGDDEIWGLDGGDVIYADYTATPGNDTVYGGAGGDFIYGGGGTDLLVGGTGSDSYEFISGTTVVVEYADEGHDEISVNESYVLPANVEDLRLLAAAVYGTGNELDNRVLGTSADNRIDGGAGADNMQGFGGNDTYVVDHAGDVIFESSTGGTDTVESSITYTLSANVENLVLTGAGVIDGTGNASINVIRGNSAANTLRGEFNNDTLYGYDGDDVLDGGLGHDAMHGGAGNDTYYFDFGSDTAIEAADEGVDTVISSIGIDLDDNVENLVVVAAGVSAYGGGNALDNIITGSAVGDYLVGYAGNDTLYGGAGYDWLRGYEGDDFLYGQTDIDDLFGFTGNDYLDGGEANDRLDGGVGADSMVGGTGDDFYVVDDFGDIVVEAAGEGVDTVESWLPSYVLPDGIENLTLAGEAGSGSGNDADNIIVGTDLANSVGGGGGNDIVMGGGGNDYVVDYEGGNDQLFGGAGNDFMIGSGGDDVYDPGFDGQDMVYDQDTVYDTGGNDEVRMGWALANDVERIREGDHLTLRVAGTTESVRMYNWFSDPSWQIERIAFEDGTVWAPATTASLRYLGTSLDDVLQGSWYDELLEGRNGNDQLAGGYGSDTLAGGRGNDLYLFEWLSGDVDTVCESEADFGDIDTLRFVIWVTPDDLIVTQDGLDLQVAIAGQSAAVRFEGWFDPTISSHVENFEFQDGAIVVSDWVIEQMINDAPVVAYPILDQSAQDEVAFGFTVPADAFSDSDPYDALSYAAVLADGSALPTWLTFDPGTRTFSGTPAPADAATLVIRVTATDRHGLSASDEFNLNVLYDGTITGSEADDDIIGTAADDILLGLGGNDFLDGRQGNDTLRGGSGTDLLVGGIGNDVLDGGSANDDLLGGHGSDTYVFARGTGSDLAWEALFDFGEVDRVLVAADIAPSDVTVRYQLSSSPDRKETGLVLKVGSVDEMKLVWSETSGPDSEVDLVVFADGTVWDEAALMAEALEGTEGSDQIAGFSSDDTIFGLGGSDILRGGAGHDTLNGGSAADQLYGGPGNDAYFVTPGDQIFELAGEGVDTVYSGQPYTLAVVSNLENLTLIGGASSGTGNELNNVITGNAGNNRLDGRWGADTLSGGAGNDTYVADGTDTVIEAPGAGIDTVEIGSTYALGENIENLALTGSAAVDGFGNSLDNVITGNTAANQLNGNAGNDTLDGGAGDDSLYGMRGSDTYLFSRGTGADFAWELEAGNPGDIDVVAVAADIAPSEISVRYEPSHYTAYNDGGFILTLVGTTDRFKIVWSPLTGPEFEVEEVRFVDGTVWDETVLAAMAVQNGSAPTLVAALADQNATEDATFSWVVPANAFDDVDIAIGDSLTHSASLADGAALPSWLSFDSGSRTLSGTPANGDVGSLSVRVTATDESGRSASDVITLTVANTNDAPMLANPIADQSATEDSAFSFTVAANAFVDIDVGDFLDYAAALADGSALPSWLLFDPGTRTFSGTPANGDVGTVSVRVMATDQSGAGVSDVFDIVVTNTNDAPMLASAIADQSAQDTVAFSFTVPAGTFADMDAGDSLTYATGALPSWLSFNAATRTFSGTPGSAHLGVVSIVVTATDDAGAQASDTFDISVGAAPDQTINGTAGNDTLNGASGNDTINGLGGADTMAGGLGNDAYFVDNAGDQVLEAVGAGIDTVNSSIGYTLGANVENLVLTGSGNINGTGNSLDNWLTGNSGKNTLAGGAGNDTYVISQSTDSVSETAGNGFDTVRAAITHTLGNNVENLVLTGTGNINGTGNTLDNSLTGNAGANILRGQGGADSLSGGAGGDTLTGGAGTDAFYFLEAPGSANADHITDFGSGERLYLEDLVHPGIGAIGDFAPNDARFFAAPGASSGADASDRVIYDTTSGRLYFDADGSGAAAPSLIAILDNVFALSAANITVI